MVVKSVDLPDCMSDGKASLELACQHPDDSCLGEGKVSVGIYSDGTVVVAFSDSVKDHDDALREAADHFGITGKWKAAGGAYFTIKQSGSGFWGESTTLGGGIPGHILPVAKEEFDRLVSQYRSSST